ncbi:MAG: DNA polymerase III subunit gamma/tau [Paludibacteraceae bacterium]|nr:DNA polymerase III subunit gamma/tau [Paludibacteraceae bacterium]
MENNRYIVSARKYRPSTFESVVGQHALTETLRNSIRQGKLAHSYLFCGPRGVGKTTCARIFAKTINCLNPTAGHDACNQCESCTAFNEQRSFNIHELDAASNNSVDDIRNLIDQVRIPPQIGKYSVYIIDEVHMLSAGAFNALLKTLEEPPSYAIFILATTEKHKVLPTILSRCQVYDFQRITVADIIGHLQYVAAQEGITASEDALNVVAQKADGGMRDALSIFDQLVAFCGDTITYERAIEVLNVLDTEYYFRLTDMTLQGDVKGALLLLDEVLGKGFDAGNFVSGLAKHLRDVLVSHDASTIQLIETSDAIRQHYKQQAAYTPAVWIYRALDVIVDAETAYRTSKNKRLTVELMLIRLSQLAQSQQAPVVQPIAVQSAAPSAALSATPQPAPQPKAEQPKPAPAPAPKAQPAQSKPAPAMPSIPNIPTIPTIGVVPNAGVQQPAESSQPIGSGAPATANVGDKRNSPFTADQLSGAWVGLKTAFKKEQRLVAMLDAHRPTLIDDHTAQVTFVNPWQEEEYKKFGRQILSILRDALQNDNLLIRTVVAENAVSRRAYTSEEKYRVLQEQNPYLTEFKKQFNMLLE